MLTHQIVTTVTTRRRGVLRARLREETVVTEVEAHSDEELGRLTRAVLAAIGDARPRAYVTSRPERLIPPAQGR
ncbi:hypothetical protein ACFVY4_26495 [Streptomyces sp. NPDC058299]|uniref:hypothetical protein n=1 Tax=Streptomyces sp. NPDC058299 TaxID=3346435 RepID=UPI0036E601E8